jgi:flavin reductase (DIM6/NTAB) family NADH-FMN oxidoreductase RutF
MSTEPKPRGLKLDDVTRDDLARMVSDLGEEGVYKRGRFSRTSLYRALAGLPVLPGTEALITACIRTWYEERESVMVDAEAE